MMTIRGPCRRARGRLQTHCIPSPGRVSPVPGSVPRGRGRGRTPPGDGGDAMPTTYNGIGTHYYGKKNRASRTAACRSCRRIGVLESYDTRLWFVVVFIPVIPLGRKRIIDSCPACSRHFAADAVEYDPARQLETSGSMDRFRRDPSPQAALEAHANLLSFHEHDQAAEFRASVLEKFPDHAALRAGL